MRSVCNGDPNAPNGDSLMAGRTLRDRYYAESSAAIDKQLDNIAAALKGPADDLRRAVELAHRSYPSRMVGWKAAGIALWGAALGAMLYSVAQPYLDNSKRACELGSRIHAAWPTLTPAQREAVQAMLE